MAEKRQDDLLRIAQELSGLADRLEVEWKRRSVEASAQERGRSVSKAAVLAGDLWLQAVDAGAFADDAALVGLVAQCRDGGRPDRMHSAVFRATVQRWLPFRRPEHGLPMHQPGHSSPGWVYPKLEEPPPWRRTLEIKYAKCIRALAELLKDEATPEGGFPTDGGDEKTGIQSTEVEQLVTLTQMASMVNRSKRTLEDYKEEMPLPKIEGGGGSPAEWRWTDVRPWLNEKFGRDLPEIFPADQFQRS